MLNKIRNSAQLTIRMRFTLILSILAIGFSLFGFATFKAMSTLNVNGPIYQEIVQGKDIIADVLPPPEYIIESYLVALQLIQASDPAEIKTLIERFQTLKTEYDSRHSYWVNQSLKQELRTPLVERSYRSAQAFYNEAGQRFLPSMQSGDHNAAQASLLKMRQAYEQHRSAIDEVVKLATARNMEDEAQARDTIHLYKIVLIGIFGFSVVVAIILTALVSRSILRSLTTAQQVAGAIAQGKLNTDIDIDQHDEIGELLRSMKAIQDPINTFIADMDTMAKKHAEGWVKEQLDPSKFSGRYSEMANQVNELIQSRIAINRKLITLVSQYAKGDFSKDMDVLPGETIVITEVMNNAKQTFLSVNNEIKILVEAAATGDFSKRTDVNQFEFMFKSILTNLNKLMETCDVGFNDILHVANALSQGDLTQTIDTNYPGTFGEVVAGMNNIVENLKTLVGDIKNSTESINTAAKEIAAGNNNLSHRTEEQAASLEETAASMEQLTSAVQHNAANAHQANQLAIDATDTASRGVEAVGQVIATMDEINESSHKIGDIISVIDDIAFQTNILALNAAVEAARAGDQGRGFAVVAVEVRNLAQRAATAAGEIKILIHDSVDKVSDGSKLVSQAGRTMEEIVTSIKGVREMMAEITGASSEQSSGIEQVNMAIAQMDDVTQQNAALVEQAAAAAESLEDQAQHLAITVGGFKVDALQVTRSSFAAVPATKAPPKIKTANKAHKPKLQLVESDEWEEF
jgi:methyl-accepting chemotaxis protein